MEQEGFNAKAAAVFKHITPRLCDNGARHSRLCERCHISPVICSQIWKWSGALRVTVLLQIRLQGNAVFITLREGEIRWCLAVALPASSDLIKVKTRPSGIKKNKKRMFEKSVSAVPGLAASFCLTSTSQQPRSGFLSLWFTSVFRPSSGFTFLSFCPRFLLFSALLFWWRESRKQRVPPASANATPQDWGLIDKSASPWTTTKHLYIRCFLWSPCSQAVQSPFKLFLFNLIVSAPFIFISSRSLGWTLARSGDRLEHFRMSFRWNLEV